MAEAQETARKVMPGRCKSAELARNFWAVTVEQGTTREDLKRPEFWAHVSKNFKPYDRIEARADDGTFFAEYVVLTADRGWAKVKELGYHALGTQDVSLTEAQEAEFRSRYDIKFNGPHLKFCVERKENGKNVRLKEKCADEAEARVWLENHLKTVSTVAA